jgi:hypothetical protein
MGLSPDISGWLNAPHHLEEAPMNRWRKHKDGRAIGTLVVFGAIGLFLTIASPWWHVIAEHPILETICLGFAVAFLTATILGLTVDMAVKRGLTADAFEGALGYLLPRTLRDELSWFYRLGVVCEEFDEIITLEESGELIVCHFQIARRFHNATGERQVLLPDRAIDDIAIDEWHHGELKSDVTTLSYSRGGKDFVQSSPVRGAYDVVRTMGERIDHLAPDEHVSVVAKGHEIKRRSDALTFFVRSPTVRPKVVIAAKPNDVQANVTFATRKAEHPSEGDVFQCEGVLIPYQAITVRWWPKP